MHEKYVPRPVTSSPSPKSRIPTVMNYRQSFNFLGGIQSPRCARSPHLPHKIRHNENPQEIVILPHLIFLIKSPAFTHFLQIFLDPTPPSVNPVPSPCSPSTISLLYTTLLNSSRFQLCTLLKFGFQSSVGHGKTSPWELRLPSGIFIA